ncbi:hypothetical protein RM533_04365 [Croceicoccus sp. F390]|uniref:Uncharacterized protein n=1 Tax=Croceicoccus esteveae TaxID=3075597 RepID=A0ABU2ZFQ3_9SPHN|nr:hypothetical protein [Croceicoccus sp. F390]MDT0575413.1 hypothetical protein [Croceicoccus sp. F390]
METIQIPFRELEMREFLDDVLGFYARDGIRELESQRPALSPRGKRKQADIYLRERWAAPHLIKRPHILQNARDALAGETYTTTSLPGFACGQLLA